MIQIYPLIQGITSAAGVGSGVGFTPVPYSFFLNNKWHSFMLTAPNLYNNSGNKVAITHESTDNGATYSVTDIDESFGASTSVTRISRFAELNISGNSIIGYRSGIFINYKNGSNPWVSQNLSTIPGGSVGGGSITSITFNDSNNTFIVVKNSGQDINTTADFVTWNNPAGGSDNPIFNDLIVSSIYYISAKYLAFGTGKLSGNPEIWESTDLNSWSQSSPTLNGNNFGTNVALEQLIISGMNPSRLAWFNSYYIVSGFTQVTNASDRTLYIFTSSNGIVWNTSKTLAPDAAGGQQMEHILITKTGAEIITNSHVVRSTNGTTWTETLLETNVNQETQPISQLKAANAKGTLYRPNVNFAPDHIEILTQDVLQNGGKILKLTQTNSTPTLGYPAGTSTGNDVGFIQNNFNISQLKDQGFTVSNSMAQSFLARHSGVRYFEITIKSVSSSTNNKIGVTMLGTFNYAGSNNTSVKLLNSTVEATLGNTPVTYTVTANQVLGFTFDFTLATLEIRVDNVVLHTQNNMEILRSWVIECEAPFSDMAINTGHEAFVYSVPGTVAWNS